MQKKVLQIEFGFRIQHTEILFKDMIAQKVLVQMVRPFSIKVSFFFKEKKDKDEFLSCSNFWIDSLFKVFNSNKEIIWGIFEKS